MDHGETWQVRLIEDDALLFSRTPDGRVVMRAVPRVEWEARLTKTEREDRKRTISHDFVAAQVDHRVLSIAQRRRERSA
jgi:hypothetical protein